MTNAGLPPSAIEAHKRGLRTGLPKRYARVVVSDEPTRAHDVKIQDLTIRLDPSADLVVGLTGDVETVAAEEVFLEIDGKKRAAKFLGLGLKIGLIPFIRYFVRK